MDVSIIAGLDRDWHHCWLTGKLMRGAGYGILMDLMLGLMGWQKQEILRGWLAI
jgi:uncharacterized membrane protein YeaQ/YmgE (transglycosylase-associated protein family)